jgi:hypothetical protein
MNRMVWGVDQFEEIRIRHTSGAPDRWLGQIVPTLEAYRQSSGEKMQDMIKAAQAKKLDDDVAEFLASRFTKSQTKAILLAHEVEEGRPIETLWDATVGATAYARSIEWQDERVDIERKAGQLMKLAA